MMQRPLIAFLTCGVFAFAMCDAFAAAAGNPEMPKSSHPIHHPPVIGFMTDFNVLDDAVGLCKGVMLSIAPDAQIVDITHQVPPFSIADGARFLLRAAEYFPADAIFVVVVDPGVGTNRAPIIAKSKRGQYFVLPNNGLLTLVQDRIGIVGVRAITNPKWMLDSVSNTFHGRDVFSPAAAHLARGEQWEDAGPVVLDLVRLELKAAMADNAGISASVVALDGPFGNLISNVSKERFEELGYRVGDTVHVQVGAQSFDVPYVRTFGDVPKGAPLLFIDSSNLVSLAVNQDSFARVHDITPPTPLVLPKKP
jgi:S-adenosylmethionine hydrolase